MTGRFGEQEATRSIKRSTKGAARRGRRRTRTGESAIGSTSPEVAGVQAGGRASERRPCYCTLYPFPSGERRGGGWAGSPSAGYAAYGARRVSNASCNPVYVVSYLFGSSCAAATSAGSSFTRLLVFLVRAGEVSGLAWSTEEKKKKFKRIFFLKKKKKH